MSPVLFASVVSVETRKLMSYRADFWIHTVVAFSAELLIAYSLWQAVFAATGRQRIGGFTFGGMVFYYVAAILVGRLVRGQERQISSAQDIYDGSLSRYLVYPAPYLGMKYAEHLGALLPALLQVLLFGVAAALVLPAPPDTTVSIGSLAMAAVSVALANLLWFLIRYPIQAVAFWADNVWTLNVMVRFASEMLGGLLLPLSLFPEPLQKILLLSPFPYLFYCPVMTLLGRVPVGEWARGVAVVVLWCAALAWVGGRVWRRGERVYTGVGI